VETACLKTSKQGKAEEDKKNPSAISTAGEIHLCCAVKKHTQAYPNTHYSQRNNIWEQAQRVRPSRCGFDGVQLLSLVKPRGCVVVLCRCQRDELLQYAPSQIQALDILSENTLTSSGPCSI